MTAHRIRALALCGADGVDVVFGVVGDVGAAHQLEVGEDGVQGKPAADKLLEFFQTPTTLSTTPGGCPFYRRFFVVPWP